MFQSNVVMEHLHVVAPNTHLDFTTNGIRALVRLCMGSGSWVKVWVVSLTL